VEVSDTIYRVLPTAKRTSLASRQIAPTLRSGMLRKKQHQYWFWQNQLVELQFCSATVAFGLGLKNSFHSLAWLWTVNWNSSVDILLFWWFSLFLAYHQLQRQATIKIFFLYGRSKIYVNMSVTELQWSSCSLISSSWLPSTISLPLCTSEKDSRRHQIIVAYHTPRVKVNTTTCNISSA
jgi:hypothetical protein